MLACQCKWITYKQLGELAESGIDSLVAIQQRYGIGTECGGCNGALEQYFSAVQETKATRHSAEQLDTRNSAA